MKYVYPKIQNPIAGTIFIMSSTFDEGKHDEYVVKFYGFKGVEIKTYTHEKIKELLDNKIAVRLRKQSFANYKEFIKIPLYV